MESSAQPRSEGPWKRQSRWEDPSCNATGINHVNGKPPQSGSQQPRHYTQESWGNRKYKSEWWHIEKASPAASSSNARDNDEAWGKWKPW